MKKGLVLVFLLFTLKNIYAQFRGRDRDRHFSEHRWSNFPVRGQHFISPPAAYISIHFGGNPYYYSDGIFYRNHNNLYEVIYPPIGIHIRNLPYGYWSFRIGGGVYFYFNGIFYRNYNRDEYEVIQAPIGAEIPELPRDAHTVVINGEKLYEHNGDYFKESIKQSGEIWYLVVGKNGIVQTQTPQYNQPNTYPVNPSPVINNPNIGDVVVRLPDNCKTIVLNGKKFFVAPDNVYYEEYIENNEIKYKVSGK